MELIWTASRGPMRERHAGPKPAQVKITSSLSAAMGHGAYMRHTCTHTHSLTHTHTHTFQLSMQYAHANMN